VSEVEHPDKQFFRRQQALDQHFRPGAPVDSNDLLKGRTDQLRRLIGAVGGVGEHVAVYGEPGVGKTSLSLVTQAILNAAQLATCVRIQCSSEDDFSAIWLRFAEYLERDTRRGRLPSGDAMLTRYGEVADPSTLLGAAASDIFFLLDHLTEVGPVVVIVDEFDRVADWSVRSSMSNLIKMLSDERVAATLVIVGVAEDVDGLIAEHTSIERNVLQIPMPRLAEQELLDILRSGLGAAGLSWGEGLLGDVARLSRGLPHYVHLMGRHIGRLALSSGVDEVGEDLWVEALRLSAEGAQETVARQYALAIASHRKDALYASALLACALTPGDEWGFFQPADVRGPYSKVMGTDRKTADFYRHLQAFTSEERDLPLVTRGEGRAAKYRFHNPLLQPYVILQGLMAGQITRADLPELPLHTSTLTPES
jgi:Cdc6-like AAA superfamily ATPase